MAACCRSELRRRARFTARDSRLTQRATRTLSGRRRQSHLYTSVGPHTAARTHSHAATQNHRQPRRAGSRACSDVTGPLTVTSLARRRTVRAGLGYTVHFLRALTPSLSQLLRGTMACWNPSEPASTQAPRYAAWYRYGEACTCRYGTAR